MLPAIIIGAVVFVAVAAILMMRRRGRSGSPTSIVMFRPSARRLSEAEARAAYRRVFKTEPRLDRITMPDGLANGFLLVSDAVPPLAIIDSSRVYMTPEEQAATAARFEHPAARNAITGHKAWVSVDAMGSIGFKQEQRAMAYTLLGPLAAELYDDSCMLLYLPAEKRIAQPGPNVEQMLRDAKIAELFGDDDLHAPIVSVASEDRQINAAIAEAKRRLPEFLNAFERSGPASPALFKAAFPTGDGGSDRTSEYIWMKLTEVGDRELVGTIENQPVHRSIPAKGATARVPLDRVVDWVYMDETNKPRGLFVDRILMKRGGKG